MPFHKKPKNTIKQKIILILAISLLLYGAYLLLREDKVEQPNFITTKTPPPKLPTLNPMPLPQDTMPLQSPPIDSVITPQNPSNSNKHNASLPPLQKNTLAKFHKPKVVIIIDDLANPKDIQKFYDLKLNLNLSLFPKQSFSKKNPIIAKKLDFYMIHLPLEAQNFSQANVEVLHVGDSIATIESFIVAIKKDFPALKYLNNHTGSRYTASKDDMQKFLQILEKYGITFVDSRTTPKSVAKALLKEKSRIYLARNVFLDNENNAQYIANQLNKALIIAQKKGYVIAIAHPHSETYKVLSWYKNQLLQEYDMIYIHKLQELLEKHGITDTDTALPSKK